MTDNRADCDTEVYQHPDHGEMEWHSVKSRRREFEGWRCTRCGTMAPPERVEEVFDSHDCNRYRDLGERLSGQVI